MADRWSENEPRRALVLAVVLPIVGLLIGMAWSAKPFLKLQQRRWDHAYFTEQTAKHPELTVEQNADGWYLIDEKIVKQAEAMKEKYGYYAPYYDWHWSVVAQFPRTADQSPALADFAPLVFPPLAGLLLMGFIARKRIWVTALLRAVPRTPASARIGMLLVVVWVLCNSSEGHTGTRTLAQHFTSFWWNIGVKLNPSEDPNDWPVIPIALGVLFVLPMFTEWAIRPLLAKFRMSHKG